MPLRLLGVGSPIDRTNALFYGALGGAGVLLWWLAGSHATVLPFWAPWDFSWIEFLTAWLTMWWFARGVSITAADERPSRARQVTFFAGVLVIYAVLETRFEYFAEHMFFLNRIQHVAMHHLGPMLLALSWPGATIARGMPGPLRRAIAHPIVARTVHVIQQPVLAGVLFVGLIFFWLIPAVHFRAMIDPTLYSIMNWSMVVDGILFWCLVLDPRSSPPARASFGTRAALVVIVMLPQIVGGAMIVFSPHDLYPFYDLCGRVFPSIDALYDQTLGGLVIWIPPAMMSVLGLLLVLNNLRRVEDLQMETTDETSQLAIRAAQWTGR